MTQRRAEELGACALRGPLCRRAVLCFGFALQRASANHTHRDAEGPSEQEESQAQLGGWPSPTTSMGFSAPSGASEPGTLGAPRPDNPGTGRRTDRWCSCAPGGAESAARLPGRGAAGEPGLAGPCWWGSAWKLKGPLITSLGLQLCSHRKGTAFI